MSHVPTRQSVIRWLADCLFVPLALIYACTGAALGCSGSVSINSGGLPDDPRRAMGTYATPGWYAESRSRVFFSHWLDGDSGISPAAGLALQQAVGTLRCRATITIGPGTAVYNETATEVATGKTMIVSIPGTWSYDALGRMKIDWAAARVTASTFPALPPYSLAAVGKQSQRPNARNVIQSNAAWSILTNVQPGPLDGVFLRVE